LAVRVLSSAVTGTITRVALGHAARLGHAVMRQHMEPAEPLDAVSVFPEAVSGAVAHVPDRHAVGREAHPFVATKREGAVLDAVAQ
jgi:hypothetical protein